MYTSRQTEAGQVDLCSERRNESESEKYTRIVTSLLLEHSLRVYLKPIYFLKRKMCKKEKEMILRLHLGEPKPGPNIVGS